MNISQEFFLDATLPVFKEDTARTSQMTIGELDSVKLSKNKVNEHVGNSDDMKISLYLPNRRKPIVICNTPTITIGRADRLRNAIPTIDLSAENAIMLGVSRLHAKLLYAEGRFYLKDMGSTNGTWLNQQRLELYEILPIQRGDQIRLGHFIMVVD